MRLVLLVLAVIGIAGAMVGSVAHLAVLWGGPPAWTKWVVWGYMGYALIQWVREGRPSPLGMTAMWMGAYGTILLSSLYLLSVRDDTTLEPPGDSFPRP